MTCPRVRLLLSHDTVPGQLTHHAYIYFITVSKSTHNVFRHNFYHLNVYYLNISPILNGQENEGIKSLFLDYCGLLYSVTLTWQTSLPVGEGMARMEGWEWEGL